VHSRPLIARLFVVPGLCHLRALPSRAGRDTSNAATSRGMCVGREGSRSVVGSERRDPFAAIRAHLVF